MILKDALWQVPKRFKNPLLLGLLLLSPLAALFPYAIKDMVKALPPLTVSYVAFQVFSSFFTYMMSPLPWQWTGDRQPIAKAWRGLRNALIFASLYTLSMAPLTLTMLRWSIEFQLQNLAKKSALSIPPSAIYTLFALSLLWSVAFIVIIGYAIALWEKRKADKQEAKRQMEAAQWSLLKAQMSPHVLLNSLNGLAELVREDTPAAVKGMQDLAEIYKQLLTLGEAPRVPLERERKLLESYLAVEQLRLGDKLKVEWDWNPQLDSIESLPLLLQPLVENAIKHGIAADPKGGTLHIQGRIDGKHIHLKVANTGQAQAPVKRGTGVGLSNLKSRLELAWADKASFQLIRETPWTSAEIKIPLEV